VNFWLLKSEPGAFGIDALAKCRRRTTAWDGVRNFQARNMLRDDLRRGDRAFFYHSSCDEPGIVGVVDIVSNGYPDRSAFDPGSKHFDAGSDPANPKWYVVDVRLRRKLKRTITLAELRGQRGLQDLPLLKRGQRLSVLPVMPGQWQTILGLE